MVEESLKRWLLRAFEKDGKVLFVAWERSTIRSSEMFQLLR